MSSLRPATLFVLSLLLALTFATLQPAVARAAAGGGEMTEDPNDKTSIEQLIELGRLEEAAGRLVDARAAALARGEEAKAIEALFKETSVRTALGGFEKAVELIRSVDPPKAPRERLIFELATGHLLVQYLQAYRWEILEREQQAGADGRDVRQLTLAELVGLIEAAYERAWAARELWGSEPVARLGTYLVLNNYPPEIRGTLRDAVTYLWVELLADSSFWTAAQSNELWRLDLAVLARGHVDQAQPHDHPLARLAAILADLASWHEANGRPQAALEARLETIRRLRGHFSSEKDRKTLLAILDQRLETFDSSLPWSAMARALEAELLEAGTEPDRLIRARATAQIGAAAHPQAPGGAACLAFLERTGQPELEVTGMAIDGTERRSIEIRHRNLEKVFFRAYSVAALELMPTNNWWAQRDVFEKLIRRDEPVARFEVDLPLTGDFLSHRTFVVPPLPPGAYALVVSQKPNQDLEEGARVVSLILSDLVLARRLDPQTHRLEVTARSGRSGRALADVEIELFEWEWQKGRHLVSTLKTDGDGRASFELPNRHLQFFLAGRYGQERAVDSLDSFYPQDLRRESWTRVLIFTDRAIYRPNQNLQFKAVLFETDPEGRHSVVVNRELTVELADPNGESVASLVLRSNRHGSVAGELKIPASRPLGSWALRTNWDSVPIQVEEYKRPTFEASVLDSKAPLRLNQDAILEVEARSYFGAPVRNGAVKWRVSRVPSYPSWWWKPIGSVEEQMVAAGTATTDTRGRAELRFRPEADPGKVDERALTYTFRVDVEVVDPGGETRTAERSFRVGFVALEARILLPDLLFASTAQKITFERRDLDGLPRAGKAQIELIRLGGSERIPLPADLPEPIESERFATPGDRLRPRTPTAYRPDEVLRNLPAVETVAHLAVEHLADGRAEIAPTLEAGAYRLRYRSQDEGGALYERDLDFVVIAKAEKMPPLPLFLELARRDLDLGEQAEIFFGSGFAGQPVELEVFRGRERVLRHQIEGGRLESQTWPITIADQVGLTFRATLLRDHQLLTVERTLRPRRDDLRLALELSTFRDRLLPGSRERFALKVKRVDGAALDPQLVDLLALMYDRSLDFFQVHALSLPDLLPPFETPTTERFALGQAPAMWWNNPRVWLHVGPNLQPDRLKIFDELHAPSRNRSMRLSLAAAMPESAPPPAPMALAATDSLSFGESELKKAPADQPGEPAAGPTKSAAAAQPLRSDFRETAFFLPDLRLDDKGEVAFEFEVPDSLTEWQLWALALTDDLRGGTLERRTRSVKDLMVRPYLPRFLREGDTAELRVVVQNVGTTPLSGTFDLELVDPTTGEDLRPTFALATSSSLPVAVEPGAEQVLTFKVKVPNRLGEVVVRARARAGELSDGEQRSLPILPARVHLAQSRFAALQGQSLRTLEFADLARDDDPTRIDERLVITLDGQLFQSVLRSLPYLVDYPYECTEQTLNRFVSTGILTALFDQYPNVATWARELAATRATELEAWASDNADPNRTMLLEETPWLRQSRGQNAANDQDLARVLDPTVAAEVKVKAWANLEKAQNANGGFPWWPGGPPSPFMTIYILAGLANAVEFGVEVPRPLVESAWAYVKRDLRRDLPDFSVELKIYLAFVLTSYPDLSWTADAYDEADLRFLLDAALKSPWQKQPPRVKAMLATALARSERGEKAKMVLKSVLDAAKSSPDLGVYWQPEERAWLFYNDSIESHAAVLRALLAVDPTDDKRHGLVQWLMLNKKLNQWNSTRSTAEVIFSLARYLKRENQLGLEEKASVKIGQRHEDVVFPAGSAKARHQIVVEAEAIVPKQDAKIEVEKSTPGLLFASATWHFSTENPPAEGRGDLFKVERRYFRRIERGGQFVLEPLAADQELKVGDQVEVQVSLRAAQEAEFVHLRDPRGAGFEPEEVLSGYRWDLGIGYYQEIRDSGANFFFERLPPGEYTFKYRLRAATAGEFRVGPATVQSMYAPEFNAYSAGARLTIGGE